MESQNNVGINLNWSAHGGIRIKNAPCIDLEPDVATITDQLIV